MEAGDPGARQSASSSANNSDNHLTSQHPFPPTHYREPSERPQHELPAMATATVLQPSSTTPTTYPPPSSYPSSYLPPASNMSSSAEPRRSPDEKDATAARQSLPSISEVISKTSTQYPAPAPPPPAAQPNSSSSFPSSFPGPPRSYAEADKHASPQGVPQGPPYGARRDPLPSYSESPRAAFNHRPSLPALAERRPSPSIKAEYSHPYTHDTHKDPRAVNGAYPQATAPPPPPPSNSYPSGPLPQGQMPLPSYPPSPRHVHQHSYPGYDQRGQPSQVEDGERGHRPAYEVPVYSAPWNYGETLGRLAQSARTTYTFAEAYGRIAQEQHGAQPIPERLPTEQELADILSNHEMQRCALERLREVIAQSIRNERAREPPRPKAPSYSEEQDVPMFEDGTKGAHYNITEVKKRRGRAAPPGRCHSCNRVDTPEWRRGPDGARTLCNACGLHYAKLERKRQLEQRNIRPKPEDRN